MSAGRQLNPTLSALLPVVVVGTVMLVCVGVCVGFPCLTTGLRYGMWLDRCPATEMRLDVSAEGVDLLRGDDQGLLFVRPSARWLLDGDRDAQLASGQLRRGFSVDVSLLDEQEQPVSGLVVERFEAAGDGRRARLSLPQVPDGDYTLRVVVDAGFESRTVDLPLPLYAPAIVHLMTDRPLYKPGQEVLLRSVVLKRTDQTPLEGRPGRWRILDPEGNEMLVERDQAGPWGIADGSFPLDAHATHGTWIASWETGGESDQVQFDVRPFRLPRFTVELAADQPWYRIGDEIVLEGRATYTSGAPIGRAPVQIQLQPAQGRWPMPLSWEEPLQAITEPDGTFSVTLDQVPPDLMDRTTLTAIASVTEAAGEIAQGRGQIVLSDEGLQIEAVTELGDGLVGGFNNRAYLRVSTPDGRPLPGAEIEVGNPYDPMDAGKLATADADGVIAIQLDPGDPVTVVTPAPPFRPRPLTPDAPALNHATLVNSSVALSLEDRRALDALHPAIAACGQYALGNTAVDVAVQLDPSGVVRRRMAPDGALGDCVSAAMQRLRLPAGDARTLKLQWVVPDSLQPWLQWSHHQAYGSASASAVIEEQGKLARRCLQRGQGLHGGEVLRIHWVVTEDSRAISTQITRESGAGLSPQALSCLASGISGGSLPQPATADAMGVSRATLQLPQRPGQRPPTPTTQTAYELEVTATAGGEALGSGRLVLPVGAIPALRLRATPSLLSPGETVTIDLLRGPQFAGALPEELQLYEGSREVAEAEVVDRSATFTVPEDVDGFLHVDYAGARAIVYVQRPDPLSVGLQTDAARYRPGQTATLTVTTTSGGGPTAAGVGLVGVDSALAQLAPLLGPDDYGRVTVRATSSAPAFGAFDPRALVLGQLQGDNAARATVLRINHLPMDAAGDSPASTHGQERADTVEILTHNFYRVLTEVVSRVRAWEASAPDSEQMDPARMVAFWDEALEALDDGDAPAVDGFGRSLTLDVLPLDLLEQVDPRQVVADGTRLPEDIESFTRYVDEEVGR